MGYFIVKVFILVYIHIISLAKFGHAQEDACVFRETLDDMNQHEITSPGFPNNYSLNITCSWRIDVKKYHQNKTINLNFTTVDIEDFDDCSTHYIQIVTDDGTEIDSFCGQHPKAYELFIDSITIIFRTGYLTERMIADNMAMGNITNGNMTVGNRTSGNDTMSERAGFKMVYQMNEEACSKVYNVNESGSLSEDFPFTRFHRCTYLLQHITEDGIVKLLLNMVHYYRFNCEREYVLVYDGATEDSPLLGKWCGFPIYADPFYGFQLLLVIVSWNTPLQIKATYLEVGCTFPVFAVTGLKEEFIHYSGLGGETTCLWRLESTEKKKRLVITFNNLDIICPESRITIYDASRRQSFCSKEDHIYLTEGQKVYVAFLTEGNVIQPVSFDMTVSLALVDDCKTERTYKWAEDTEHRFISPLHPGHYPSKLNCIWEIRSPSDFDIITMNITDIDLGEGCRDSIRIYNGAIYNFSISDPDLVICGNSKIESFKSKGDVITVQFVTDGAVSGTGFNISYVSPHQDKYEGPNIPTIVNAGIVAAIAVSVSLIVIICAFIIVCILCYVRKKRQVKNLPHIPVHVYTGSSQPKLLSRRNTLEDHANPAFQNGSETNQSYSATSLPPPSYKEIVQKDTAI